MINEKRAKLIPFWIEDKGLSFFLGFLVFMTIFVPMVRLSRSGRIVIDLIFALIFFSGAVATIRKRILVYLALAFTLLEFTADLIIEFYPSLGYWGWDTTLKIFGFAILVVMTLKHTFRPGPISAHRVMGGVATYLLIGMIWAFGYKLLMETHPDAIHFRVIFQGNSDRRTEPLDVLQLFNPDQRELRGRSPSISRCPIAGDGGSARRTTLSFGIDRNAGGDVPAGAI